MSVDTEHPLQHEAEREASKKRPHAFGYLAALFAAALLLLGMAYLMQQRANDATISGLTQSSLSAMQSVEALMDENKALQTEVAQLEAENMALQESLQETEDKLASAYHSCAELQGGRMYDREVIFALDVLRMLEQAYGAGDYKTARTFMASMENLYLLQYLDTVPLYTSGTKYDISAADRYRAIADALN